MSELFILTTVVATALALAAVRLGVWAGLASIAAMFAYLAVGGRQVLLRDVPYIGDVALSATPDKLPFIAVSLVLGLLVTAYAPRYLHHLRADRWYYAVNSLYVLSFAWIVMFENLAFVFLALELSIITSFLLIWYFGYGNRRVVALLYFIWAQVGSILFLVGAAMAQSFDAAAFKAYGTAALLVLVGLLVKMGTLGVHFWLPYAHAEAPTPLSALLSPVHVGLMAYWIWRLKAGADWPLESLYIYGLLTAIYGSLLVFREVDIKRALADSTIANMGLLAAAASIRGDLGYWATALLFTAHAFAKAAGFMLSGIYIVQLHTRQIDQLAWDRRMLALGVLAFVALSGVFGLGLVGKIYVALGVPHSTTAVGLLIVALFSTALYNFYLFNRVYRAGAGEVKAPGDMYYASLASAAMPYVLLAALPWLLH